MALDYSIINNEPALGFANLSYDVGSAITEYVRSAPIGSQVTVRVTNLVSGNTVVLQEGTDYYTGADGVIVVDRDLVPFGAQISFSLDTDFENFYDDFGDLGAAPSGPVKRRTQQLQNMALQLRDRIETLESGDIDVDFTETSIIAGNNTYGPGAFQIDTDNGVTLTDVAGTGFRIGLNYGTIFDDSFVVGKINNATQAYIEANPPASGVVTVSGRSPDGAGNIDLAATDVSGLATVATSGDYSDLTNTPQNLGDFNNNQGFIGTTELATLNATIADKLDASALDGGAVGQVLKKTSGADGAYAWADESGGPGSGASILSDLGDVTLAGNPSLNEFLVYTGSTWENQLLNSTKITDFNTDVDARISAVGFDGDYDSLSNKPTLRTDQEVRDLADAQITAYVAANPVLPSIQQNSADIATNAGNIATNTTNITNNANAIAGKLDEPSGTPNTGDVIEWDGSQAAWAAPSGGSGGGIEFWQIDFGLIQEIDGVHSAQSPNLNGTELTNGTFGTYSVDGSTPTFTFSAAGTYKITLSLGFISTLTEIRSNVNLRLNGTVVNRVGMATEGAVGFGGTELEPGGTPASMKYMSISASDVLTLAGDVQAGTWIIEKVG